MPIKQMALNVIYNSIALNQADTKHLYNICTTSAQSLRRWSNIVQMVYKCFVLAGIPRIVIFLLFKTEISSYENEPEELVKLVCVMGGQLKPEQIDQAAEMICTSKNISCLTGRNVSYFLNLFILIQIFTGIDI